MCDLLDMTPKAKQQNEKKKIIWALSKFTIFVPERTLSTQ